MKKIQVSLGVLAAVVSFGLAPSTAQAQGAGDNFDRDRNIRVRDRPKPEYEAAGVRVGGMWLYPELTLGAEYNDNIFATEVNTQEDIIYHVTPEVALTSRWSTHELAFELSAPSRFHTDFDENDTTDVIASARGRLDVYRDFYVHGAASYGDLTEPLSSNPSALPLAEPIEYVSWSANLGLVKAFNRVRISAEARQSETDFSDGILFNLTPLDQDDRDRVVRQAGLRFDYALSPMTALFLALGANERDYDLDPPAAATNRDSSGYEALVGVNFDLTRLMRGEIGVGYLSQEYEDPNVGESTGLAVRTRVEWFPDELVTVTFAAAREVADAGAFGAASYIANNASFAIDYEWRRNVVFGFRAEYSFDDYAGIDREDERWAAIASADYLFNRNVALFAEAGRYEQTSQGLQFGRDYEINRAVLGVRLRR